MKTFSSSYLWYSCHDLRTWKKSCDLDFLLILLILLLEYCCRCLHNRRNIKSFECSVQKQGKSLEYWKCLKQENYKIYKMTTDFNFSLHNLFHNSKTSPKNPSEDAPVKFIIYQFGWNIKYMYNIEYRKFIQCSTIWQFETKLICNYRLIHFAILN